MKRLAATLTVALVVVAAPSAYAAGRDGARKAYACNPQKECLERAANLKGSAAEGAKRDCARMPTSGTCFGAPDDTPGDRSGRTDLDRKKK